MTTARVVAACPSQPLLEVPPEVSVYPAEQYGMAESLEVLQGATPDALTLGARIALERTTKNPQMFGDDVPPTKRNARMMMTDAAGFFAATKEQEEKLSNAFPPSEVPLRIGNAPTYASGLQRTAMSTPTAAVTLFPMLAEPPVESLSALLRPRPKPVEEEAGAPE